LSGKLEVNDIRVTYPLKGQFKAAVNGVSFTLESGQIGCLLGASGSGKTTVLRAIAGFEPIECGTINIDSQVMTSADHRVPPENRHVGMMFQDYALFPHLDVKSNIGFGLRRQKPQVRAERVSYLLDLVGLTDLSDRYPHELSGGQQQRVALARSLAPDPDILLLDEPFSNLDLDTREHLAQELRQILKQTRHTALMVTHNHDEAFAMADYLGFMADGKLAHWGTVSAMQQFAKKTSTRT
jgi:iron(III) transport system ATP-binding protein